MSDSTARIVDTPIELELVDNILSFPEESVEISMMENNSYPIKIYTNEDLSDCQLVMKRYGEQGLIKIGESLAFGTTRLIVVSILDEFDKIEKQCWGVLEKDLSIEDPSNKIYVAELYEYLENEDYDIIPNMKKIDNISTNYFGKIQGRLEKDNEGDFFFLPTEINVDKESETYLAQYGENAQKQTSFILEGNDKYNVPISIKISIELNKDFSKIPDPPMVDDKIVAPEKIKITVDKSITDNNNFLLNNLILSFKDFELDFSSYEEIEKVFRFNKSIEFSKEDEPTEFKVVTEVIETTGPITSPIEEGNIENGETNNSNPEGGQEEEPDISEKTITIKADCTDNFKIIKEILISEEKDYKSVFGTLIIDLKIYEEDLSKYELKIDYDFNFNVLGKIEKVDDNGNFLYYLPEKEFIYEDIQKVERDGTGEFFKVIQPIYEYEIDSSGKPVLDSIGVKIPIFERDAEGKLILDEEGYAIYKKQLDENGNPKLEEVNEIEYVRDSNGQIMYELVPVTNYQRKEDGSLYVDEETSLPIAISKELNGEGQFIYEKRATPLYAVNDNNEVEKDENGELKVVYKKDGTGEILLNDKSEPILAFEKDIYGNYILDDNDEKIPIYETITTIDSEGNEIITNKKGVIGWKNKVDSNGNLIYITEKQENIPDLVIGDNADFSDMRVDGEEDKDGEDYEGEVEEGVEGDTGEGVEQYAEEGTEEGTEGDIEEDTEEGVEGDIEEDQPLKIFNSNLVQEYEKEIINGKEYYKIINNELIPVIKKDDNGNDTFVYQVDDEGKNIVIEDFIQLMEEGNVVLNSKNNVIETINTLISYEDFAYSKKQLSKEDFLLENEYEKINNYVARIPSTELPSGLEKILLGIAKYDKADGSIKYATNGLEIKITRSIETMVWDPELEFLNEKVVVANYSSDQNWYYEISSTLEYPIWLEGKENYIYIDRNDIEISDNKIKKIIIRKWRPDEGFYELNLATPRNLEW